MDYRAQGYAIYPALLSSADLSGPVAELPLLFPTSSGFHDETDPRRSRFIGDEFAGIDEFPFASPELNLLAVHPTLIDLAASLLGTTELRLSSAEVWAKYSGAADYGQELHRDYLGHTLLTPCEQEVELFVFLVDVPDTLGPPHLVPHEATRELPVVPNWLGAASDERGDRFLGNGHADLYAAEVSSAGPAGTVVAWGLSTFHRGTAITAPRGARFTMHMNFRVAEAEWLQRRGWAMSAHDAAWYSFVPQATPRQLELFGWPAPGHAYWTPATLGGIAQRYPGLDVSPWAEQPSAPSDV